MLPPPIFTLWFHKHVVDSRLYQPCVRSTFLRVDPCLNLSFAIWFLEVRTVEEAGHLTCMKTVFN